MIERIRTLDSVKYVCTDCNIELAEYTDLGEVIIRGNCSHYKWIEVSSECFYNEYPECGRSVIRWLKQNYLVKLDDGYNVNLLIPRQS